MGRITDLESICHSIEQQALAATIPGGQFAFDPLELDNTVDSFPDDISDCASIESVGTICDLIGEMRNCTECLVDFLPALENPARDVKLGTTQKGQPVPNAEAQSLTAQPWWTFFHLTEDKFPFADRDLIIRISETLWRRRERIFLKHEAKAEAYGNQPVTYK
jgi:hypothetical protein